MSGGGLGLGVYALATRALSPLAGAVLRARARAGREDPARLPERLGHAGLPRPAGPLAWLHGASVGESLSLLALAGRLNDERPATTVLVTSGTRAAAEVLAGRLPGGVLHQYVPLDTPGAARRFIAHWRPDLAVFVESELWPNLIAAAKAGGARLAMVSGRVSPVSARRWRLVPRAAGALFASFDLILARDEAAAATLRSLGAAVDGLADAKLGAAPLPIDEAEAARLRAALGERSVVVAASTHPGEEALILAAFAAARPALRRRPLLVIVPRHAGRGEAVAELARAEGLAVRRRSDPAASADLGSLDVYVSDTLGELGLWYRLAGLAVLGGSLVTGVGGHNPLEPARLGRPILAGPHTDAWPIYADLEAAGGCARIADAAALGPWLRALAEAPEALPSPEVLESLASRAEAFARRRDAEGAGALDRVVALIDP